jgi:hypothetical protein
VADRGRRSPRPWAPSDFSLARPRYWAGALSRIPIENASKLLAKVALEREVCYDDHRMASGGKPLPEWREGDAGTEVSSTEVWP